MLGKNGELVAGAVDPSNLDDEGTHTFEMSWNMAAQHYILENLCTCSSFNSDAVNYSNCIVSIDRMIRE
jgi:hypothetical protein